MNKDSPWEDISVPETDFHVRLVEESGVIPYYWGRDTEGRLLFILSLEGDHSDQFQLERISLHGIQCELRQDLVAGRQRLVLMLESAVDRDLFLYLCRSLSAELKSAVRSDEALDRALTLLKRWKAFLSGRRPRVLTLEEILGLFGELTFLEELGERTILSDVGRVHAWTGPDDVQQDFVFHDRSVEIKSLLASDPRTVRISSENQLETIQPRLFLVTYLLSECAVAQDGHSLNQVVSSVRNGLTDPEAASDFDGKLISLGYLPLPDYDLPFLRVTTARLYEVRDEFPRLVRSRLPAGIVRVGYQIQLEAIAVFECSTDEVWAGT